MSSSPTLEPENSHILDTSTPGASQGFSEAASVAAEDAVAQTPSTRVDAAKESIAGQARRLVMPRRSLLLTGGVAAAAGVLAAMPQIAATGVLGEDAAVVVSTEKLLARRERLVRENIDTRYLKIESLGRIYVGQGRREQDLRLGGFFLPHRGGTGRFGGGCYSADEPVCLRFSASAERHLWRCGLGE